MKAGRCGSTVDVACYGPGGGPGSSSNVLNGGSRGIRSPADVLAHRATGHKDSAALRIIAVRAEIGDRDDDDDAVHIESDVHVLSLAERANEQARGHEQQRGHRDLREDEDAPPPAGATSTQRRASFSVDARSSRVARNAGPRPKRMPIPAASPTAAANTRRSGARSRTLSSAERRRINPGSGRVAQIAMMAPPTPPISERPRSRRCVLTPRRHALSGS